MTIYCDASVIVSLLIDDANSRAAVGWFSRLRRPLVISDLAALEFSAVVSRNVRTRRFAVEATASVFADFESLLETCERRSHSRGDFAEAEALVRDFTTKLVAADALHLASAMNAGLAMATFDDRLMRAAVAKGVEIVEIA